MHPIRHPALIAASAAVGLITCAAEAQVEVFMSGLANPRSLNFDGNTLYVAEAGAGGTTLVFAGPEGDQYYGTTGGVSRRSLTGSQELYLTGLPSLAGTAGFGATGPHDVGFDNTGLLNIAIGLGADPAVRQAPPLTNQALGGWLGTVVQQNADFSVGEVVDISDFEAINNPDGGVPDSNPFGLAFESGTDRFFVTDAGGNTLLTVEGDTITDSVTFDSRPNPLPFGPPVYQPVPTGVAIGPDGDVYVAELTGFPFAPGEARIWRIDVGVSDPTPELVASGMTNLIDLAFGADGTLYALEHDSNGLTNDGDTGALLRINADGSHDVLLSDGLVTPTGLTVGPDGAWYISNNGLSPTEGQVIRFIPEPGTATLLLASGGLMLRRRRLA